VATWALLAAMRAEHGGIRSWIIAGVLAGLAAGLKYNAGLVVLTLPLLAVWRLRTGPTRVIRALACAAIGSVVAFLITTPYAVFDAPTFFHDLGYEFRRVATVPVPFEGAEVLDVPAVDKIGVVLWHYFGILGVLAAVWGAVAAIRTRSFAGAAVVVWIVVSLLPQLRWKQLYARYLLPIWPAIILLTAWGITDLAKRTAGRWYGWKVSQRYALIVLAVIVLVTPTIRLVHRETRRLQPDPRPAMTEWIKANIPEGERLAIEPNGPFPGPQHYSLDKIDYLGRSSPNEYRARGIRYVISSGRERAIEGEEMFREVLENLQAIRESSRRVWESGKYVIYLLEGGPSWDEAVRNALEAGDLDGARSLIESEIEKGETTPYMWKTLAEVRATLGDTLAAMDAYLQGARQDTSDVEIYLALSNLYLQQRGWDQALAQLELARRVAPNDPLIHHKLAVAYLYRARNRFRSGSLELAREDWVAAGDHAATAAKFAPGDPDMTGVVGQVERMGKRWGFAEQR
jgi:tetratricopeptide (TPR) repeat protein